MVGDKLVRADFRQFATASSFLNSFPGMLAAAGKFAIQNYCDRLRVDHENALYMGNRILEMGLKLSYPVRSHATFIQVHSQIDILWLGSHEYGLDGCVGNIDRL